MYDDLDPSDHGNRPDDMTPDQQCSILLSNALDCLGYNQDMVKHRVAYWKMMDDIANNKEGPRKLLLYDITAGSQAEGVIRGLESDSDTMLIFPYAICTDNPFLDTGERNITIFQTVNYDTAPGYTKLRLCKIGHVSPFIKSSLLLSECGDRYMSSDLYTRAFMIDSNKGNREYTSDILTKSGPAVPIIISSTQYIVHDIVHSFKCHCPALLRSWLKRPRQYNWPPRNVLYDISQMDAHVVPVGCKGSDTYTQEWRICFTKAEIHLIHCLNDTQTKLYIVLKNISKQILKPLCSEITSYIMKNIVLWICEHFSKDSFTEKQLFSMIIQAIVFLNKCVAKNYLPSYMIPERNLFIGRIEPEQKFRLLAIMSSVIEEGPAAVIKRIDKIRHGMFYVHRAPAMAYYYRIKRDLVENLVLIKGIRAFIISQPDMTTEELYQVLRGDDLYKTLQIALQNLIVPEWRSVVNFSKMYDDRLKTFLS